MKKFFLTLGLILFLGLFILSPVKAENNKVELKLFYGIGCPHCALERNFLNEIISKYQEQIFIEEYEQKTFY